MNRIDARYGGAMPDGEVFVNTIVDGLLSHRTVRHFRSAPLPAGTLEAIAAAAQSAATSSNLQTYSIVAVANSDTKRQIGSLSANQAQIADCPLLLVFCADLSRLRRLADAHGVSAAGLDHFEMFLVAAIDAALAGQNAVIAAESLGLGTCYIGAIRNNADRIHALLGLPRECVALFGLCIGHPDPQRPGAIKPRLPQAVILHRERYDVAAEAQAIATYDARLAAFNTANGAPGTDWVQRCLSRVGDAAALSGRHQLGGWLKAMGFGLK
jgi:nitroreductase